MPNLADRQFRRQYRKKHKLDTRLAFLGDNSNPVRVRVPGRPNMVYVRYPASTANTDNLAWPTVVKMDRNLTDTAGTGVVIGDDDEGDKAVLKLSTKTAEATGNTSQQGTVNNRVNEWVDLNYSPLMRVQPMGAGAPLFLSMLGFPYIDKDGVYHDFRGISGGMDCSSFLPGSVGEWRLIAPWLKSDDTHEITASTAKNQTDSFVAADLQELVDARSTDSLPSSVWIARYGQTIFSDTDKYLDWRQWINLPQTSGSGSIAITDGTTAVDPATTLSLDPDYFDVTAPGGDQADATFIGTAANIGYTPDVSGDWNTPPSLIAPALDELAERTVALEDGANKDLFTQTANTTVANTTTETTLLGSGQGSATLPVDYLTVGRTIKIVVEGFYSSALVAGTITFRVKLGSVTLLATAAVTLANSLSNDLFKLEAELTCRSTGGSGSVIGQGILTLSTTTILAASVQLVATSASTIDTTATQAVNATVQWGTADAANTITCTNAIIQMVDANTASGGGGAATQYILIQERQTQNTSGGTFGSGSWHARVLNTVVNDDTGAVSLSSNQFTLPAGTYRIHATAPAYEVGRHQTRLYNITDAAIQQSIDGYDLIGTSAFSPTSTTQTESHVDGEFTIAGSKAFEFQHQAQGTKATNGFGVAANFTTEIYSVVTLEKVA